MPSSPRGTDREEFNPRKVSPSRIGTYADCGEQFRLKYIERMSPEREGTAALFGKVMHHAREHWVLDRSQDMIELTRKAWIELTKDDQPSAAFLQQYAQLSSLAIREEELIRRRRPEIKNVRMTKDWKQSEIAGKINRLLGEWIPKLNASKYDYSERDPLPGLYDESLILAWKYSDKWRTLPNAYLSELAYDFEWHGFQLIGYIDDISPLLDKDTGEMLGHAIVDAKTYKTRKHSFKDWRQGMIYTLAYRHLASIGALPVEPVQKLYFGVDEMRLLSWQWFEFDDKSERKLLKELETYERAIENHIFIPASKTCHADWCDFRNACEFFHGNAGKPLELNVLAA